MHKKWRIGETGVMCTSNEQRLDLCWYHFVPTQFFRNFSCFWAQLNLSSDPCEFRSLSIQGLGVVATFSRSQQWTFELSRDFSRRIPGYGSSEAHKLPQAWGSQDCHLTARNQGFGGWPQYNYILSRNSSLNQLFDLRTLWHFDFFDYHSSPTRSHSSPYQKRTFPLHSIELRNQWGFVWMISSMAMVENLCKAIWLLRVASFLGFANSKPMCFQGLRLLDCVLWWYHVKMFLRWRWIDGDCSWPPGWGGWDRSFESNSFLNSFSENTSGTSLFSRPRWVEVYNRGGCTLKHCWEKISDPSMERLRMDDERSLVSVWVFLWIFVRQQWN